MLLCPFFFTFPASHTRGDACVVKAGLHTGDWLATKTPLYRRLQATSMYWAI